MTIDELKKIDALISGKPAMPPERIYHWLDTQLSIARHYGGMDYQGHRYVIAFNEPGAPLVRADVLEREAKEAAEKLKADAAAYAARQGSLL
jgi:hypothetical protein